MNDAKSEAEMLQEMAKQVRQKIAQRAYHIFEKGGFEHGNDLEHWLQAEKDARNYYVQSVCAGHNERQSGWVRISHAVATLFPCNDPGVRSCNYTFRILSAHALDSG